MCLISRADAIALLTEILFDEPPYFDSETLCRLYAEEQINTLPSAEIAETEPIAIRSRTLLPTKDFKEWAKRIREVNPNSVVIPCDAEIVSAEAEWIPFRDDLLIRENAAEVVGEFFNKMDISLFGRTGVRLARNVLNSVPTVAPLKWIPLNKDGHEPLFEGDYLLCLDDGYIASVYFDGSDWELWADSGEPIAWMPLPKPYREDGQV